MSKLHGTRSKGRCYLSMVVVRMETSLNGEQQSWCRLEREKKWERSERKRDRAKETEIRDFLWILKKLWNPMPKTNQSLLKRSRSGTVVHTLYYHVLAPSCFISRKNSGLSLMIEYRQQKICMLRVIYVHFLFVSFIYIEYEIMFCFFGFVFVSL